jgi:DNA-binding transcriptional LysR family regulator
VSTPAVTQLIGALERSIGTILLHRSNRAFHLLSDGERYYYVSRGLANGLRDLEQQLGPRAPSRGDLERRHAGSVGENCVMPTSADFLRSSRMLISWRNQWRHLRKSMPQRSTGGDDRLAA